MAPFFTRLLVAGGFLLQLPAVHAQPGHVTSSRASEKPPLVRPQQLMLSAGAPALQQLLPAAAAKVMPAGAPARTGKRLAATAGGAQLARTSGPVSEQWAARYNGKANTSDQAAAVVVDAAGNVYVTGSSSSSATGVNGNYDYATVKYAPSGEPLWEARYDGPTNGGDAATAIAVDAAGNVYVTGYSDKGGGSIGFSYATVKYSASGQQLWVARYGNGSDVSVDLALDAAGDVYVSGSSNNDSGSDLDYATIKYAGGSGQQLWAARYNGPANDYDLVEGLAVDAAGNAYVTGTSYSGGNSDYATVKYSASGQQLWVARYDNGSDNATAVAVDAAGNVYVTGASDNSRGSAGRIGNSDYATVKYAGSSGEQLWEARYNGPANSSDEAKALAVDAAGSVSVTGYSTGTSGKFDYATIKYDGASGQQQWAARYDGPANAYDVATSLAVDAAGNVYVTGYSGGDPGNIFDYATIKYASASGQQQWAARYNGPANGADVATSLAVDAAGNVAVTGYSYGSISDDYATLKYSTSGQQLWLARYNGPSTGSSAATDVAVDGAGNVYVTGYSYGSSSYDYVTVKYAASGEQLWEAHYDGPGNGDDVPADLAVDAAGNVYVTGSSPGSGSRYDYATVKYSASGQELWSARYNGSGNSNDYALSLAVDGAGNVVVTGGSRGSGKGPGGEGNFVYITLKYSASGQRLWGVQYFGEPYTDHVATAVTVDAAGNAYVTGYSYRATRLDYATIKYASASGQQLWAARYNGPSNGDDVATAVAVDAAGNVYVTGSSDSGSVGRGSNYDYATLKYAGASGQQLWEARYNGPANRHDLASGLAVDAAGSVFVTGTSDNGSSSYDYATLKYSTTGQQVWEARYNGPANSFDEATDLALDAAGNAYVTGRSYTSDGTDDYATLKYAGASGQPLWEARYNGPANSFDEPAALAVDATGNVYVTGRSLNGSGRYDYATVKYVQPGEAPAAMATADRLGAAAHPAASTATAGGSRELAVYPNPAAEQATVSFRPVLDGQAQVEVYNQLGQRLATLYEGAVHAGQRYALPLRSQSLAPGAYQCSVTVNGRREQVRLLIAR